MIRGGRDRHVGWTMNYPETSGVGRNSELFDLKDAYHIFSHLAPSPLSWQMETLLFPRSFTHRIAMVERAGIKTTENPN